MKSVITSASLVALVFVLSPARAAEPKPGKQPMLYQMSMDVEVLRTFFAFQLSDEQLKALAKIAKETMEPSRKRAEVPENEELRRLLTDLCDAFADGTDEDKITSLEEELNQLVTKLKVEFDDSVEITKAARQRAPEVIKSLKAGQLAMFYGSVSDDVLEPVPYLTAALQQVRGLSKDEWHDKRDKVADDVAWAVAGIDLARSDRVTDSVVALLSTAHALSNEEFTKRKAELEKEAKTIIGEVGPDEILRHRAERTVAEMLSNPRLEASIKAKLK